MSPRASAAFVTDGEKSRIVLREGVTLYEVFHEFQHFRHSREIGLPAYHKMGGMGTTGELPKEMYVYNKIMDNMGLFTREELVHANDYINRIRRDWGQLPLPLDLPNNFPQVRPKVNSTSSIK